MSPQEQRKIALATIKSLYDMGLSQYEILDRWLCGDFSTAFSEAMTGVHQRGELDHIFHMVWSGMFSSR